MEINPIKASSTRFAGLQFAKITDGLWMFIDADGGAQIGPQYARKEELLADLQRFAEERGFA